MRVVVLGSGGREHALAWSIAKSPLVRAVVCAPGSDGIARDARCAPVDLADPADALRLARAERADLVVVGPEGPLEAGVVDHLEAAGVPVVGPTRAAAELEWSKAFAKAFMARHGIPTAQHRTFDSADEAERYARARGGPIVVKADGLAAGKAVAVCDGPDDAVRAIGEMLRERRFGAAGARVVLEERLVGAEASYYVISDGERFVVLPHASDHKRVLDGDRGENTGGMGAFSPARVVDADVERRVLERIVRPTLDGMRAESRPYRGVLYVGLIVVRGEPYVIEFNARMGDPETQPVLLRLESDLVPLLLACAQRRLGEIDPASVRAAGAAVCVVMASKGYPRSYPVGLRIEGLAALDGVPDVKVFHAGTRFADGAWLTAGGRVLGVTARGASLGEARERAYRAVRAVHFEGAHFRSDIGAGAGA
jgi:phosphoribosylamine--glycine ligase